MVSATDHSSENYRKRVLRIVVVLGTRPEAIKLAPVVSALRSRGPAFDTTLVSTGQHREMLDQVLHAFDLTPDLDLDLMQPAQRLSDLTARVLQSMTATLHDLKPDVVLVQGDTTTVFATALAAFYQGIAVGHVEAGLRSHDLRNPYPEEMNRRLVSVLTAVHFAPTALARDNLVSEGVSPETVCVTGNPVVDSVQTILSSPDDGTGTTLPEDRLAGHRLLLVTSHRRENWGTRLEGVCNALRRLVSRFDDLLVVYPVHLNPRVKGPVEEILGAEERILLLPPLAYAPFLRLMQQAYLIITDSGGVQEEAPILGKPVLVVREVTERPEASRLGIAQVIGTDPDQIVRAASRLLTNSTAYTEMTRQESPYGDGKASERIVNALERWRTGKRPLLPREMEFVAGLGPVAVAS